MPDPKPSSRTNPVHYAETTLGVHRVYEEAQKSLTKLGEASSELADASAQRRSLGEMQTEKEAELISAERAANPEMSATAFDAHIRQMFRAHPDMRKIRYLVGEAQNRVDAATAALRVHEAAVRTHSARMTELGGLLSFYAAAKSASRIPPA